MVRSHSGISNVTDPTLRANIHMSGPKQCHFTPIEDLVSMVSLTFQLDEKLAMF